MSRFDEVAGEGAQTTVERVEGSLYVCEDEAQHQRGEGDENGNDQPHVIDRVAGPVFVAEPGPQRHADRRRKKKQDKNDKDEPNAVNHPRTFAAFASC